MSTYNLPSSRCPGKPFTVSGGQKCKPINVHASAPQPPSCTAYTTCLLWTSMGWSGGSRALCLSAEYIRWSTAEGCSQRSESTTLRLGTPHPQQTASLLAFLTPSVLPGPCASSLHLDFCCPCSLHGEDSLLPSQHLYIPLLPLATSQ